METFWARSCGEPVRANFPVCLPRWAREVVRAPRPAACAAVRDASSVAAVHGFLAVVALAASLVVLAGCRREPRPGSAASAAPSQSAARGALRATQAGSVPPDGPARREEPAASSPRLAVEAPKVAPQPKAAGSPRRATAKDPSAAPKWASLAELRAVRGRESADAAQVEKRARALTRDHEWEFATEILIEGERRFPDHSRFGVLIERSLRDNPLYAPPPRLIERDGEVVAIKPLGGGSTVTLRFMGTGELPLGAFKPAQARKQSDFRAEIAAFRLCPLVRCSFDVAYNEHVVLSRETFDALYAEIDDEKQAKYARDNFADLEVTSSDGVDWIHGALEEWVPAFVQLPIERTEVWQPWLTLGGDAGAVAWEAPAIGAYTADHTRGSQKLHGVLRFHLEGVTQRELARQISNMISFDFLATNWDRFSGLEKLHGANCHVSHGRLLSIDNGAAFQTSPHPVVLERLRLVQRFSRQFVAAVRALDVKRVGGWLFRDPTARDHARLRVLDKQRRAFLSHVDDLVAQHGEREVLFFE